MEEKLDGRLEKNLERLRDLFEPSEDLYLKPVCIGGIAGALCAFEGLADLEKLWVLAVQPMNRLPEIFENGESLCDYILRETAIPLDKSIADSPEQVIGFLTAGAGVILLDGCARALIVAAQGQPMRSISEPNGEGNLRGSHEGFTELLRVNVSLLRRLIRTPGLHCEIFPVGSNTRTEAAMLYHEKTCPQKLIDEIRKTLQNDRLPMIFDSGYLMPFLVKTPFSLFTPAGFTERPDTAAAKLCEGKAVILVNGSPYAMLIPHFFSEHFQSMDDYLQRPYFSSFIRVLRYCAFLISILLPGAFLAVTDFTPELLPPAMLYQIAKAQITTPLSLFGELLVVNFLLEIIREAGLRLPKSIGQAVSLVAALIVGDAAVQIGLLGTPVLVICALAGLCSYVVPSLYEPGIVLRLAFILAGGMAGPVGMAMLGTLCLLDVCRPEPLGLPYTAPLTPYSRTIWHDGLLWDGWRHGVKRDTFSLRKTISEERKSKTERRKRQRKGNR